LPRWSRRFGWFRQPPAIDGNPIPRGRFRTSSVVVKIIDEIEIFKYLYFKAILIKNKFPIVFYAPLNLLLTCIAKESQDLLVPDDPFKQAGW